MKMELELKHLKLNPVTVTVTPVFPIIISDCLIITIYPGPLTTGLDWLDRQLQFTQVLPEVIRCVEAPSLSGSPRDRRGLGR